MNLIDGIPARTRCVATTAILAVAFATVLYTGHPEWIVRVGVLAIALLAFFFGSSTPVRWAISASILILSLFTVFYRLGDGSLYNWDEAVYAQISKEMLMTGTWSTPIWNGTPFFQKPPLQFWLTRILYYLIGINEFAARFWSAFFGCGVVVITFLLGSRLHSWPVGAAAALLLLSTDHSYFSYAYNFLGLARVGMVETGLTFWLSLSLLLNWEANKRPWVILLLGISVAFGVMTKGWSGLFAVIIILVFQAFRDHRQFCETKYWIISLVVAALIVLPWHLWELWKHGKLFVRDYILVTFLGHIVGSLENHGQYGLFYFDVISEAFPLWKYFFPPAYLWGIWRAFKYSDLRCALLITWITIPFLLFSIAQTKLLWYISIIYPALALLLTAAMAELMTSRITLGTVALLAVYFIRLPLVSDGSPEIKLFAQSIARDLKSDVTVQIASTEFPCNAPYTVQWVPPALLFYLNTPLTCVQDTQRDHGAPAANSYIALDRRWNGTLRPIHVYLLDHREVRSPASHSPPS